MKLGFSKIQIAIGISFLLAFVSIMLTYVLAIFVYFTLGFLLVGFVLLSITLIKNYKKFLLEQEHAKTELLMELSVSEQGEKYVLKNSPYSKAELREIKAKRMDRLIPIILCISACLLIVYFIVMQFIPYVK